MIPTRAIVESKRNNKSIHYTPCITIPELWAALTIGELTLQVKNVHQCMNKEELIADLHYLAEYAEEIRKQIISEQPPSPAFVTRMKELGDKVHELLSSTKR